MEKKMWTDAPDGELVDELVGADEYDEARKILARIRQLDGAGYGWQDCAIIYRTNQSARVFDQVFRQEQIPFNLIGAHKFFDRKEIRDVVAYLKLLANPFDKMAFERVVAAPKRGIGPKSVFELLRSRHRIRLTMPLPCCGGQPSEEGRLVLPLVHWQN